LSEMQLLLNMYKDKTKYTDLLEWVTANTFLKSPVIRAKALEVFPSDYRSYAVKTAKSADVISTVTKMCNRSLISLNEAIPKYELKLEAEARLQELVRKTADTATKIHVVLDSFLQINGNTLSGRELDCLRYLIDCGTVDTEDKLREYTG
jgi:hypothetical protein